MCYEFYPYGGWFSPWGPPPGMGYPMAGPWTYPYGGMSQMPFYQHPGGFGAPGMPQMPYYPGPGGGLWPLGMPPFGPHMSPNQEISFLRDQAQMLKQQIDQIDARIKELEKSAQ